MQTENDYDRDVFNGYLGTVLRIDEHEGLLIADFDAHHSPRAALCKVKQGRYR
jgi:ATP-dependent exoDNAse (exonuclease V) alpha subunit